MTSTNLITQHGGYRRLKTFQISQLVYDLTVAFCSQHVDRRSRTHDQMVQAARSGVQNIAEGSEASATSKKTEIKLTNVARASLEELLLDFEDHIRQRALPKWSRGDERLGSLVQARCRSVEQIRTWMTTSAPGVSEEEALANAALTLISIATALLERQTAAQCRQFEKEGGFTERMHKRRTDARR